METSDTEEDKQSVDEHILEDLDSIGMANNIKKYKELEAQNKIEEIKDRIQKNREV